MWNPHTHTLGGKTSVHRLIVPLLSYRYIKVKCCSTFSLWIYLDVYMQIMQGHLIGISNNDLFVRV